MFRLVPVVVIMSILLACKAEGEDLDCDKCPPGTFWAAPCQNGNRQPECLPCQEGRYTESEHTSPECEICQQKEYCPQGTIFINSCSPTTNSRCVCPDGQYWHIILGHDGRCFPHKIKAPKDNDGYPASNSGEHHPNSDDDDDPNGKGTDGGSNHVPRPSDSGDGRPNRDSAWILIVLGLIILLLLYVLYPNIPRWCSARNFRQWFNVRFSANGTHRDRYRTASTILPIAVEDRGGGAPLEIIFTGKKFKKSDTISLSC